MFRMYKHIVLVFGFYNYVCVAFEIIYYEKLTIHNQHQTCKQKNGPVIYFNYLSLKFLDLPRWQTMCSHSTQNLIQCIAMERQ